MQIGSFSPLDRVLVVAEVGNNHEGSLALAEALVEKASEAGADAVKFQTFRAEHYVARRERARFEQLRRFELTIDQFARLRARASECGLAFLSTPFDLQSARGLEPLVDAYKIASGDNTFWPLLEAVAGTGKPVFLSTGLADLQQITAARGTVERVWRERGFRQSVALLHCVSAYPVPPQEANLAAIGTLREAFGGVVGYSDHTLGIEAAVLAVAAGARIVEKHFTVSHEHSGFRDHRLSADPAQMAELVRRIREAERLLGDGRKVPQPCERVHIETLRRSIVASRNLAAGAVVGPGDITWVRPGGGLAPGQEAAVVGRRLAAAVGAGEPLVPEVLLEAEALS